jgi:hypothetical protein
MLSLPGTAQQGDSLSEEEKRRRFLKAREEIQPTPPQKKTPPPSSSPAKPVPKPKTPARPAPSSPPRTTPPQPPKSTPAQPVPAPKTPAPPKAPVGATPAPVPPPAPSPAPVPPKEQPAPFLPDPDAPVVIEKSGVELKVEPAKPPTFWQRIFGRRSSGNYKYLTPAIRQAIDRAPVASGRWKYIVVHNSGTRQGNAKAFDFYHTKVRKMSNGLAYHFVIGNGTSSGNGAVEIGSRWTRQISGGHVHSDYLNSIAIGICLVGDFNQEKPRAEQLEALDELVRYLRERVGKSDGKWAVVKAHREINPPRWPTDCPGNDFPYRWLHSRFD